MKKKKKNYIVYNDIKVYVRKLIMGHVEALLMLNPSTDSDPKWSEYI